MNIPLSVLSMGLLLAGVGVGVCAGAESKMAFSQLPPAVQKAAKAEMQDAQLVGAASEMESGKRTYEVETKMNGKSRDLSFDAAGKLLEVEQEVEMASIPDAAQTAIKKRAGSSGKIDKVESVTAAGSAVSYEASVTKSNGRKTEIAVNADGTPHRD